VKLFVNSLGYGRGVLKFLFHVPQLISFFLSFFLRGKP